MIARKLIAATLFAALAREHGTPESREDERSLPGDTLLSDATGTLTHGVTIPSRLVSTLWTAVFRLRPARVGGCRPIHLAAYADPAHWRIAHRRVVTPYGIPSEVLVLDRGEASQRPQAHQAG